MSDHAPASPFPETADIETASDSYAARFAGPTGQWMLSVQERITLSLLTAPPDANLLDVGGGHAQLAGPLVRDGFHVTVTGSDPSCGRRLTSLAGPGSCRFQLADSLHLPFPDQSFDACLCFRLVTHCADWQRLVSELCRTARRAVIIDYPATRSLDRFSAGLFNTKKQIERNTRPWRLFRETEIRDTFARHGFHTAARRGQFFLPMVLHRALHCRTLSAALEAASGFIGLNRFFGSPVIVRMTR